MKEALANGRLTARGGIEALVLEAERHRATPDALALAAVLAQPWADIVLSGASTTQQLASNLEAATLSVAKEVLADLAETPAHYWKTRAALPWT